MNTPLRPHIKKLLTEDLQKLLIALFILFFVSALLGGALFLACFCGSLIYFEYVSFQSKYYQRYISQL